MQTHFSHIPKSLQNKINFHNNLHLNDQQVEKVPHLPVNTNFLASKPTKHLSTHGNPPTIFSTLDHHVRYLWKA